MRVTAVLLDYPPHRWIGSELATHAAVKELQRRRWPVRVLSYSAQRPYVWDGVQVLPAHTQLVAEDLLITHPYKSPVLLAPINELRRRAGTPVAVMAHNARDYTLGAIRELGPEAIFANCMVTARALGLGMEHVVRPPLMLPARREILNAVITAVDRPRSAGYVNSATVKGGNVILELSNRTRDYSLLGVSGGYGSQLVPGQAQLPHTDMAEQYYRRVRVHLQPSLDESWGMAALEALSNGCMVVASDLPGPREALMGVPRRWIRWVSPEVTSGELDLIIRELLAQPAPTEAEARRLVRVLVQASRAAADDRGRMFRTLQRVFGGRTVRS